MPRVTLNYTLNSCSIVFHALGNFLARLLPYGVSHTQVSLFEQARAQVFFDSGLWETTLLRSFDRLFRGGVLSTLTALSSFGIGERASIKLGVEFSFLTELGASRGFVTLGQLLASFGGFLLIGVLFFSW